jgi:pilus assembly protein TadC
MKKKIMQKRRVFESIIEKSGMKLSFKKLSILIFQISIILNLLISGYFIYHSAVHGDFPLNYIIVFTLFLWTFGLAVILLIIWLAFYLILDLKIYQRKVGIEDVFPDFLQLTSANIRAGMPIDQALWHAIRPNFGVLAKEMEDVAKQTMSGTPLEKALEEFAAKYESKTIKRSISLLTEGLNAGSEIGDLLDKIATNIHEAKIMQKEMSASVTTYAIFIGFASVLAAPFLLAMSSQLLVVIEKIISTVDIPKTGTSMIISFSKVSVKPSDFNIFAMVVLGITSVLSAAIIAIIKKGNIKAGFKYIPAFLFSTILLYLILEHVLGIFILGMF